MLYLSVFFKGLLKNALFKKIGPKKNPLDIKLFFLRTQEATVLTFALKRIILSKVLIHLNISLILALV